MIQVISNGIQFEIKMMDDPVIISRLCDFSHKRAHDKAQIPTLYLKSKI